MDIGDHALELHTIELLGKNEEFDLGHDGRKEQTSLEGAAEIERRRERKRQGEGGLG